MKILYYCFGILAGVVTVAPGITFMGLIFLIVPGLLMMIAPTLFIYWTIILGARFIIKKSNINYPTILSILLSLGIGLTLSALYNNLKIDNLNKMVSTDINSSEPIMLSGTIAFITSASYASRTDDLLCGNICQNLLYNGVVKNVLIAPHDSMAPQNLNKEVNAYTIEKQENCIRGGVVYNDSYSTLNKRLNGECIKKYNAPLSNADFIYSQYEVVDQATSYHGYILGIFPLDIEIPGARGNRVELKRKLEGEYKTIYRFTQAATQLFIYPFSFGPILSTGSSWNAHFGIFRYSKSISGKNVDTHDGFSDLRVPTTYIFGNALNAPATTVTSKESFSRAIQNPNVYEGDLNELFEYYLNTFFMATAPKGSFNEEDKNLIISALSDMRIKYMRGLIGVNQYANPAQRIEIYDAAIKRILLESTSDENYNMKLLADFICYVDVIKNETPNFKRLQTDPLRLNYILKYYQRRISEGWSNDGKYEQCIADWKE